MPYLIDGQLDGPDVPVPMGTEILSDDALFALSPGQQFGVREDNSQYFLRAQFSVGRVFSYLKRPRKSLPARLWNSPHICDRIKRALEEMEPGKHLFVPIDLRQPDKATPWPEPYWFWRCAHYVDAIIPGIGDGDPKRSSDISWNNEKAALGRWDKNPYIDHYPVPLMKPVLNREAIEGRHAWKDNGFLFKYSIPWIFRSDEIVDRLRTEDAIKGLNLRKVETSDLPATRCPIEN